MTWNGQPAKSLKRTWQRHAADCGVPEFTRYTVRHFMATRVRRAKPPVSAEERSQWLGHVGDRAHRTTRIYEKFDPDYLADCSCDRMGYRGTPGAHASAAGCAQIARK